MRNITSHALLCLLAAGSSATAAGDGQLTVAADPALVEIGPRPPGPRIIQLPNMRFALHIAAQCGADMQATSASVSVGDTRRTLGPELLADASIGNPTEQSVNVPQNQLAPLSIENFCFSDDPASHGVDLLVADALTAQVSLSCTGEDRHSIIYQAANLDIALRCTLPAAD